MVPEGSGRAQLNPAAGQGAPEGRDIRKGKTLPGGVS